MDDVGAGQVQLDGPAGRDDQAAIGAGRHGLLASRAAASSAVVVVRHVVELPLELAGDRADLEVRLRGVASTTLSVCHEMHEQERDDDRRDDGPDDLGDALPWVWGGSSTSPGLRR